MWERLKHRLANFLLRHVFKALTDRDILLIENTNVIINSRSTDSEYRTRLLREADTIRRSALWKHMNNEMRVKASELALEKSTSASDLLFGKALLFYIETINRKLEKLSNM